MPLVRGSRFRENNVEFEKLKPPFKEESIKINEELKALNIERDLFDKQRTKGLKAIFNKRIFNKEELSSKYNLYNFFHQLKKEKDIYNKYENCKVKGDKEKIDIQTINEFYDSLEDRLLATIWFIEMIEKYKESNFELNKLYDMCNQPRSSFVSEIILTEATEVLFSYIKNYEIINLGKKMYNECTEKMQQIEELEEYIANLEDSIQEKKSLSLENNPSLEQLKQYKKLLEESNDLLSKKNEDSIKKHH